MLKDEYRNKREISFESMQQPCQSFQDPIADQLDGLCGQNHSSFSSHEIKSCYDIDMIRQSVTEVCSAEASVQSPLEQLQRCQEMHEDEDNRDRMPELPSKNQGTCHFYLDPVATYMKNFFNTGHFSIASVFPFIRVCQILCKGKQVGNYSQARVTDLFLSFITDSERTEPLKQLLDWLHWNFSIT